SPCTLRQLSSHWSDTLSLHDALPILEKLRARALPAMTSGAKKALSRNISVVAVVTPLSSPPMMPPSASARTSSAISTASGSGVRSEEHTSELQSRENLVCRLLLEEKQ